MLRDSLRLCLMRSGGDQLVRLLVQVVHESVVLLLQLRVLVHQLIVTANFLAQLSIQLSESILQFVVVLERH